GRRNGAQAADATELGKDQRHEVVPTAEGLVIGVRIVALDNRLEPRPRDRFEEAGKDAIPVVHARLHFLSLDNQKIAGSRRKSRACASDIVTHSPDSRACKRGSSTPQRSPCLLDPRLRGDFDNRRVVGVTASGRSSPLRRPNHKLRRPSMLRWLTT